MTPLNSYTIDTISGDKRFTVSPDCPDPGRLEALAKQFSARKTKTGYILTPFRAQKFDALYRAGFDVLRGRIVHPNVPGKTFTDSEAMHVILLSGMVCG